MPDIDDYKSALKQGQRAYREALSRGEYPYLQVLEEMLNHVEIVNEVPLGISEIPLSSVVGTYAAGRRTAFAPNFMPLLSPYTEFGMKWAHLSEAHLNEGIKDPVKVFEYMHRYYVVEGNKRVSVLKYYHARSVSAQVTRLVPERSDAPEIRAYYEYLEFYKNCPVNYLVFNEPGGYEKLLEKTGFEKGHPWSEEELRDLRSVYVRFETAYKEVFENRKNLLPVSEALLVYLDFYGYRESIDCVPAEFRDNLLKIEEEIRLLSKDDQIELVLDADEGQKKNFFERLFSDNRKLRIAFIYTRSTDSSAWTYSHELGRLHLQETFGEAIETVVYEVSDPENDADRFFETIISEQADIIFATTPVLLPASLRAAVKYPDRKILCCALNTSHYYVRTYYARLYEAKFLSGIIAGAMAENGEVGYLTDYPIPANIANLNAFSRGVSMVNPTARVHVQWTGEKDADPLFYFAKHHVRIISGKDYIRPEDEDRQFGLYRITEEGRENLAMPIINWGILYRKLVTSIQNGAWEDVDRMSGGRALNYYWGMDSDAVDLVLSQHVPEDTAHLVSYLMEKIRTNEFSPFQGKLTAKRGLITEDEDGFLSPQEIAEMDWLHHNIIGTIPKAEDLTETAQALTAIQGIPEETEDQGL